MKYPAPSLSQKLKTNVRKAYDDRLGYSEPEASLRLAEEGEGE